VPGRDRARALNAYQRDLAAAAGTSLESVVRTLRHLHRIGAVETGRGRIVVLDLNLLRPPPTETGPAQTGSAGGEARAPRSQAGPAGTGPVGSVA
jgi:hypothetical protein